MLATTGLFMTASPLGVRMAHLLFRIVPGAWKGQRSRSRFSLRSAHLLLAGAPLGLLGDRFLHVGSSPLIYALLAGGAAVYFSRRLRRLVGRLPLGRTRLWLVASLAALWVHGETLFLPLLGHDGGQAEFTGSLADWIRSEGGTETAIHSAAGTLGTVLGPLAGGALEPQELPEETQQNNKITSIRVHVSKARFQA